ncbi:hypothetical protein [Cognaticolwellia beringensis]|uniref:Uncharacterized protein n=1 Tax=Cognaticolwellia beringensis TaxID=1967665 RepID=A0A222G5D4_9GAMM|nr:hypothetical protein [Cognaticolwellia beringensis]ASP47127.1 hypothetical protein B5D82_04715 [Cognaticolwellia beringensis]
MMINKQCRINAEIHGHLLPRLTNLLNMNDVELIKEQIFILVGGLEDLSELTMEVGTEISENVEEHLNITARVELLRKDDCWFDRLLLPLSDIEKEVYARDNKAAPDFRFLFKKADGSFINYRFYVDDLKAEFNQIYKGLTEIVCSPFPTEYEKDAYVKITNAIFHMDFIAAGIK